MPGIASFSMHSLRVGGVSTAANARVMDRLFQWHGWRRSVSVKDGYVEDNLESRLLVPRSLGT